VVLDGAFCIGSAVAWWRDARTVLTDLRTWTLTVVRALFRLLALYKGITVIAPEAAALWLVVLHEALGVVATHVVRAWIDADSVEMVAILVGRAVFVVLAHGLGVVDFMGGVNLAI
jgi:hypothetical protein